MRVLLPATSTVFLEGGEIRRHLEVSNKEIKHTAEKPIGGKN